MSECLKLMCVLAHPDDETLGVGGTLAKYASEGVETYLVTATHGQRGWQGDPKDNPGLVALASLREAELRAAAQILGLKEVCFLDYIDGGLDQADPAEAISKIAAHVRRVRPHVVVSFGPDGAYGHPDHIAISQFATAAVICAADSTYHVDGISAPHRVSKFYYRVENQATAAQYQALFGDLVMAVDGVDRSMVAWPDWTITTRLDTSAYWSTVMQAVLCHLTQHASLGEVEHLSEARQKTLLNVQTYYRVFSAVNGGRALETDLFAGLRSPLVG